MKLKGLNAFFGNSKVLLIAFILVFASKVFGILNMQRSTDNTLDIIFSIHSLLIVIMGLGLFFSYVLHESNIQKSLLSNIYLLQIIHFIIELVDFNITKGIGVHISISSYYLSIVEMVIWVVTYLVHLIMLSDKVGKSYSIRINQLLFFIILIIEILVNYDVISKPQNLVRFIYISGLIPLFLLVCIDTKIGIYKRTRLELKEKGKWDDKAKAKTKEIFNLF